jgi:hypothetical protein
MAQETQALIDGQDRVVDMSKTAYLTTSALDATLAYDDNCVPVNLEPATGENVYQTLTEVMIPFIWVNPHDCLSDEELLLYQEMKDGTSLEEAFI